MTSGEAPIYSPPLGREGDICGTCRAPLAVDQRYCLNCGRRRTETTRVALDEAMNGNGHRPSLHRAPPAAPSGPPVRGVSALGAGAGAAVVLAALLLGVLIGDTGDAPQARAPVVTVNAPAAAAAGTAPVAATAAPTAQVSATPTPETTEKSAKTPKTAAPKVSDEELQKLENAAPEEFQKQQKKLPDEIGTEGAAPPTDNAAPGGGSEAEEIG